MSRAKPSRVRDQLTDRDIQLLRDVVQYRLLTTRQIQRLHLGHVHPNPIAAARSCTRTLARLRSTGLLKTLERRIGGARAGSAGHVWYLGHGGERLLDSLEPSAHRGRRNYREPSSQFVDHTLAVVELAVQAKEAARAGNFEILGLQTEPASWQQLLGIHGQVQTLKPDLRLVTATAEYEQHWFIEADRATEHLPVIRRQCAAYEAFRAAGRYQAAHGLFPAVLWVVPNQARATALRGTVGATAVKNQADGGLFQICTAAEYSTVIAGEMEMTTGNEPGGQEGGTPS